MKQSFLALSRILTGFEDLKDITVTEHYNFLLKNFKDDFIHLLKEFDKKVKNKKGDPETLVKTHLWKDDKSKKLCQTIIKMWYTATLNAATDGFDYKPTSQTYYEALLWKAVEAHPPGLSGGYFGYWRYAPEN